jgi:excisionase family DNA binding protein
MSRRAKNPRAIADLNPGSPELHPLIDVSINMRVPRLPLLLTIEEAADLLRLSRPSVLQAIESGALRTITMLNRQRIVTQAMLEYFDQLEDARKERLKTRRAS